MSARLGHEPIPHGTPDFKLLARLDFCQTRGQFAFDKINKIDLGRISCLILDDVIERKRATNEWIIAFEHPNHQKLPWLKSLGHRGTAEPTTKRLVGDLDVLDYGDSFLNGVVSVKLGVKWICRHRI